MQSCLLIGDADSAAAFSLAGVYGVTPRDVSETREAFRSALAEPEAIMIIITEGFAQQLADEIGQHRLAGERPMIVEIPENLSGEFSGHSLMEVIRSAVGISI